MTETELKDLHRRFTKSAFWDHNGKWRTKPPVKMEDLAWVMIENHHSYAHEWWKEYVGVIVLAKLIFHETLPTFPQKWRYLYEVIPIKIDGSNVYVARSIIASCVRVLDNKTQLLE